MVVRTPAADRSRPGHPHPDQRRACATQGCFRRSALLLARDQLTRMLQRRVEDLWRHVADGVSKTVNWADLYQTLLDELGATWFPTPARIHAAGKGPSEDASPGLIQPSSKSGSVPSSGCAPGKTRSGACGCALNVSVSCTTHSKPVPIQVPIAAPTARSSLSGNAWR